MSKYLVNLDASNETKVELLNNLIKNILIELINEIINNLNKNLIINKNNNEIIIAFVIVLFHVLIIINAIEDSYLNCH